MLILQAKLVFGNESFHFYEWYKHFDGYFSKYFHIINGNYINLYYVIMS